MAKIEKTYQGVIDHLPPNGVFVFTSNGTGFHGAGSAGFAMFGTSRNIWREKGLDKMPHNTPGLYAVKGIARGFQVGTHGMSYAIQTVTHPGVKRSISLGEISAQIRHLVAHVNFHTALDYYVAGGSLDTPGLSGYTGREIRDLYVAMTTLPPNLYFPDIWRSE